MGGGDFFFVPAEKGAAIVTAQERLNEDPRVRLADNPTADNGRWKLLQQLIDQIIEKVSAVEGLLKEAREDLHTRVERIVGELANIRTDIALLKQSGLSHERRWGTVGVMVTTVVCSVFSGTLAGVLVWLVTRK